MKKGVAHELRPVGELSHGSSLLKLGLSAELPLSHGGAAAEHIQHNEIDATVPINIREIDAHRVFAGMTERQSVSGTKNSFAIVEPEPIRSPIIVANIQIRKAITIHIAKSGGQTPVAR